MKKRMLILLCICLLCPVVLTAEFKPQSQSFAVIEAMLDSNTNLLWQVKETDQMNWEQAQSYCKSLELLKQNDWRLPQVDELQTLLDRSRVNPAADRKVFPDMKSGLYWTATPYTAQANSAWHVNFHLGNVNFSFKRSLAFVRCVRSQ